MLPFLSSHTSALIHVHTCPGKLEEKTAPALSLGIGAVKREARNAQVERNLMKSIYIFVFCSLTYANLYALTFCFVI